MFQDKPAWIEHQRRRFLRPDWQRYMRPDWKRWVSPDLRRFLQPDPAHDRGQRPYQRKEHAGAWSEQDLAIARRNLAYARSELAAIKAELRFRQLLRKAGFNPDQPRVPAGSSDGGQWTGGAGAELTLVAAQDGEAANAGDANAIESTRQVLHNTLARVNAAVSSLNDVLSGALYGIRVHKLFADDVRQQDLPGIGVDGVEQSFDLDGLTRYGADGSIRTDVVLRNAEGKIIAIYDVKTGNATMGPTRADQIRQYTNSGPDVPVIILHALKGSGKR
jgi:hypothetical protein